ncbi:MarR family winged helix-turn-helix transcriptional regulator [Streptomyces sp. MST-110588]|uniref:MarR family winged helix-turn-helix transcriptional regulator n=1 Tax=Streptomyces sp. MST-110588 TaxID=2833628 RepID=UPI001F5CE1FD|nr:MarR family winged helix-turn-helix transcriptional regulator [Streptomyces sp. MST-110588]UNO42885.1 winged helix-turn-helix transcriptional regulator [Streptomyces sp. MST-110588]
MHSSAPDADALPDSDTPPGPEAPSDVDALIEVTTEVFAVNGRLLREGDRLCAHVGLTSARWQVAGLLLDGPSTVARLARERGLRRQAVQQTVERLRTEGVVTTRPNPRDQRSPLVELTAHGRQALDDLRPLEQRWLEHLAEDIPPQDMHTTIAVLRRLREKLDAHPAPEPAAVRPSL